MIQEGCLIPVTHYVAKDSFRAILRERRFDKSTHLNEVHFSIGASGSCFCSNGYNAYCEKRYNIVLIREDLKRKTL